MASIVEQSQDHQSYDSLSSEEDECLNHPAVLSCVANMTNNRSCLYITCLLIYSYQIRWLLTSNSRLTASFLCDVSDENKVAMWQEMIKPLSHSMFKKREVKEKPQRRLKHHQSVGLCLYRSCCIWSEHMNKKIIKSTVLKCKDGSQGQKDSLDLHVHAGW